MPQIPSYTAKTVLTDNDLFVIADSAAANATKKATRAAILSDATALIFTIGGTARAKVTSAGLLVDKITSLTPATDLEIITTDDLRILVTGVIDLPAGGGIGDIFVGGTPVADGVFLGVTSITVKNGLVTNVS